MYVLTFVYSLILTNKTFSLEFLKDESGIFLKDRKKGRKLLFENLKKSLYICPENAYTKWSVISWFCNG